MDQESQNKMKRQKCGATAAMHGHAKSVENGQRWVGLLLQEKCPVRVQPLLCWHRVNPIKLQMPDITRLRSCPRLGDSLRPFVPLLSQTILAEFGASPFKFRPNPLRLRAVPHRENSCQINRLKSRRFVEVFTCKIW